jgi:hypothetical protein
VPKLKHGAFAYSCASGYQYVFPVINELAFSEAQYLVFLKISFNIEVKLLDAGIVTEACVTYLSLNAPVIAIVPLRFNQKANHLIGSKSCHTPIFDTQLKSIGHSEELELSHF